MLAKKTSGEGDRQNLQKEGKAPGWMENHSISLVVQI
jgi:hypothetical protein